MGDWLVCKQKRLLAQLHPTTSSFPSSIRSVRPPGRSTAFPLVPASPLAFGLPAPSLYSRLVNVGRIGVCMKRWVLAVVVAGLLGGGALAESPRAMPVPWAAVDGLGRKVDTVREPQPVKYVGVLYYIWHGAHGYDTLFNPSADSGQGPLPKTQGRYTSPYVIPEILQQPAASRAWGPHHAFHHWGESRWGYYLADDEWVIRRNAQLLADAGVDVVILDVTNGYTYRSAYETLCRVYTAMRAEGNRTPQVAFISWNGDHVPERLYREFYGKGLHRDLWFQWEGKPLLFCKSSQATDEMKQFFTLRESWAWTHPGSWFGDGKDKWPWLADTPQAAGWHDSPEKPEQVSVATAQHPTTGKGKSYHDGKLPPSSERETARGPYFAEQWKRALEVNPDFLLITQWNEWMAQRFLADGPMELGGETIAKGDSFFVDVYTDDFNRDIEPMKGGYADNFYYQMVDGIRRFKGTAPAPVDGVYTDDRGDIVHRDHPGYGSAGPYVNTTGRNDIVAARVECTPGAVRISATTAAPLSPATDAHWMMLFIRLTNQSPHWESFQWMANRQPPRDGKALLERSTGGWNWEEAALLDMKIDGSTVSLEIPRALLEAGKGTPLSFDFKWVDNMQSPGDATDWMVSGDAAPNSRFVYTFREQSAD